MSHDFSVFIKDSTYMLISKSTLQVKIRNFTFSFVFPTFIVKFASNS